MVSSFVSCLKKMFALLWDHEETPLYCLLRSSLFCFHIYVYDPLRIESWEIVLFFSCGYRYCSSVYDFISWLLCVVILRRMQCPCVWGWASGLQTLLPTYSGANAKAPLVLNVTDRGDHESAWGRISPSQECLATLACGASFLWSDRISDTTQFYSFLHHGLCTSVLKFNVINTTG